MIDRRAFIVGLGAVLATPVAIGAQRATLPLLAILEPGMANSQSPGLAYFTRALEQLGWLEGRTIRFETRYGEYATDRITAMIRELVRLKPDVLYTHSDGAARAAIRATTSIPIVVGAAADLLALGGINSLARPGGNVTGVTHAQPELDRKRLEILKEAAPSVARIAFLVDPQGIPELDVGALSRAAELLKIRLERVSVNRPDELTTAFSVIVKDGAQAVLVQDTFMLSRSSERVTALALQHRLPTVSQIPPLRRTWRAPSIWRGRPRTLPA